MNVSNLHPENLSLRELSHYGLQHDDVWIQRLSFVVYELLTNSDREDRSGWDEAELAQFFDDIDDKVNSLEYDVKAAETHAGDLEDELETANSKISSLQFDLSRDHQAMEISHLKAHIYEKSLKFDEVQRSFRDLQHKFEELAQNHSELQAKYNTWVVIAT